MIFSLAPMRAQPSNGDPKIFKFWGEEKWRQAKLAREFLLASPFRRGIVATMTTTACLVSMRMMIMISNASNQRTQFLIFFFSRISPQFTRITALRLFIGFWSKTSHFFLQGEGELFLAFGGAGYTLRSYQFGNSSLSCIRATSLPAIKSLTSPQSNSHISPA